MAGELRSPRDFLGYGPLLPLRRLGPADFVMGGGVHLVRGAISQIIKTRRGELRWKPTFGIMADSSRHKLNTDELEAVLRSDIEASIHQWEPRVSVVNVTSRRDQSALYLTVNWQMIDRNVQGNEVLLGPDTFEVQV